MRFTLSFYAVSFRMGWSCIQPLTRLVRTALPRDQ